jgi:hypothetical protein
LAGYLGSDRWWARALCRPEGNCRAARAL